MFLSILLYICLVPIFYIISKRFMERSFFLANTYYTEFNIGILCCLCLFLGVVGCRNCFLLNVWRFFEINFDYVLMIFSPTISISLLMLGFLVVSSLCFCFSEVRCEEYLVLLYTIVFIVCVAASFDFISIFVILECINICTYILIASGAINLISIYSSLKYVMVTVASTCFLLIGIVLLYLQYSHFNLMSLKIVFEVEKLSIYENVTIFSICSIFISIMIKLGVFPFYRWLVDVYSGFSNKSVLLVSTLLKMSSLVVLLNVIQTLSCYCSVFSLLLKISGLGSMCLGGLGAVFEWKLNRFVAFAGLFSMGTIFLVVSITQYTVNIIIFFYMVIYNVSIIYLIIFFNSFNVSNDGFFFMTSQPNIYNMDQTISMGHLTNIFSLINLPPFAGFYPKIMIGYLLYVNHNYFLLFMMLLLSMLGVIFFVKLYLVYFTEIKMNIELQIFRFENSLYIISCCFILFNIVVMCVSIYILIKI